MKLRSYTKLALHILQYKLFEKRTPSIVSYIVTSRCSNNCAMCGIKEYQATDLSTTESLSMIDRLCDAGTVKIMFTGGEPFVREDLPLLVGHCAKRGVSVSINTSGAQMDSLQDLVPYKPLIRFSLDGPHYINDRIRYHGSYQDVIHGVAQCQRLKIPAVLKCTINSLNIDHLEEMTEIARDLQLPISFHPCGETLLRGNDKNPLSLSQEQYVHAMQRLIQLKKKNPLIANSRYGLELFAKRADAQHVKCLGGYLFCRVDSDGRLRSCGWDVYSPADLNLLNTPVHEALANIPEMKCPVCMCESRLELNMTVAHLAIGACRQLKQQVFGKSMRDFW